MRLSRRVVRFILYAVIVLIVSGILSVMVLFLATRPSLRVLWQNCQPETITYDQGEYCMTVIEREPDFGGWPFFLNQNYAITVGQGTQTDYGHMVDYSFTNGLEDVNFYVNQSRAQWMADGVEFIEADGHRLFIPATRFMGGR